MTFKKWFKSSIYKDRDILDITKLYCYGKNLTDLNGIDRFTNLEVLDCSNNNITSLEPIKNLTNLKLLGCANNKIGSLEPLKNLTNLEYLYCSGNKIESLEQLKYLTSLKYLSCSDNPIIPKTTVYIPFLRLTYLTWDNCIPIFKGMDLYRIQDEIMRRNMNLLRGANGVTESYIKRFKDF